MADLHGSDGDRDDLRDPESRSPQTIISVHNGVDQIIRGDVPSQSREIPSHREEDTKDHRDMMVPMEED